MFLTKLPYKRSKILYVNKSLKQLLLWKCFALLAILQVCVFHITFAITTIYVELGPRFEEASRRLIRFKGTQFSTWFSSPDSKIGSAFPLQIHCEENKAVAETTRLKCHCLDPETVGKKSSEATEDSEAEHNGFLCRSSFCHCSRSLNPPLITQ